MHSLFILTMNDLVSSPFGDFFKTDPRPLGWQEMPEYAHLLAKNRAKAAVFFLPLRVGGERNGSDKKWAW